MTGKLQSRYAKESESVPPCQSGEVLERSVPES